MTTTFISLISIYFGIAGGNLFGFMFRKYSFGFTGNTLIGVFGSILIIKSFGKLGFDPVAIMDNGSTNITLFIINMLISFCGAGLAIIFAKKLQMKMDKPDFSSLFNSGVSTSINLFKIVSFLEGISYLVLLFIAVPIKYIAHNDFLVKLIGMPHGILFIAYIFMALFIRTKMKWNGKITLLVLAASILPFGTFYVNRKYLSA